MDEPLCFGRPRHMIQSIVEVSRNQNPKQGSLTKRVEHPRCASQRLFSTLHPIAFHYSFIRTISVEPDLPAFRRRPIDQGRTARSLEQKPAVAQSSPVDCLYLQSVSENTQIAHFSGVAENVDAGGMLSG